MRRLVRLREQAGERIIRVVPRRLRLEDAIAAGVTPLRSEIVDQEIAVDAVHFTQVGNMTGRAADLREGQFAPLELLRDRRAGAIRSGWRGKILQKLNEFPAFVPIQIEPGRLVFGPMRNARLRMIGNVQADLNRTGRHREVMQVRLLGLPTEAADLPVLQPRDAARDLGEVLILFRGRRLQDRVGNGIDQTGTEQRDRVSLRRNRGQTPHDLLPRSARSGKRLGVANDGES